MRVLYEYSGSDSIMKLTYHTIYVRIYDFCENSYLLFLRKLINFCHCLKFDFSIVSSLSISTIFNVKYHFAYLLLLNTKSTVAIDKASKNIKIRK